MKTENKREQNEKRLLLFLCELPRFLLHRYRVSLAILILPTPKQLHVQIHTNYKIVIEQIDQSRCSSPLPPPRRHQCRRKRKLSEHLSLCFRRWQHGRVAGAARCAESPVICQPLPAFRRSLLFHASCSRLRSAQVKFERVEIPNLSKMFR